MSLEKLGDSSPDEIFYSDSTIQQKLTYLQGLHNTLERDCDELWEHEDEWTKSMADLKMKKIDVKSDMEFLEDDLQSVNQEGFDLQEKIKLIQKRIKDDYGQVPITDSKHFKIIVMVLVVIFALCLISFYFFIGFVIVSCGYFIYVFKTYLNDKVEQEKKGKEKGLLEEQLNLLKNQLENKIEEREHYQNKLQSMENQIRDLHQQHQGIERQLDEYKRKRNDLEKTKQYLSILIQYDR